MHWGRSAARGGWVCAILLCAAAWAQAPVYRWVDSGGQVHYGDQPPINATPVKPSQPVVGTAPPASDQAPAPVDDCKRKKDQLTTYTAAQSISETDALGNVHQYSDDEKQKLLTQTRKFLDDNCGGAPAPPAAAQR